MKFRRLGRTSLKVSEIGLGTEYLTHQPTDVIFDTIQTALQVGMNYIDIVFTYVPFLQVLNQVVASKRDKAILTLPLGAGIKDGKHKKLRSEKSAKISFEETIKTLGVDYIDIAVIQYVTPGEYDKIMAPRGLIQYAEELKQTQVVNHLGMSIHNPETALRAVESEDFDLIMTHQNFFSEKNPKRQALFQACIKYNVGLVAIKPFAGGQLLSKGKKRIPTYKSGYKSEVLTVPSDCTAIRCLSYILDQPALSTVIPGVKNKEELLHNLQYYEASPEELDYTSLVQYFSEKS
ncbi:MAG: aldo/keto reductase [Candidatus Heimdallarchaeota archaeon]|nr:MAG: aldo/keto reductase [Candidatus Heimdallarchaeota archaeon]